AHRLAGTRARHPAGAPRPPAALTRDPCGRVRLEGRALAPRGRGGAFRAATLRVYGPRSLSAVSAGLALRRARRGRDRRALSHPRELRALRTERGAGRPDDARHRARAPAAPGRVDVLRVDATPGRDDRAADRPGARREPQE